MNVFIVLLSDWWNSNGSVLAPRHVQVRFAFCAVDLCIYLLYCARSGKERLLRVYSNLLKLARDMAIGDRRNAGVSMCR